MQPRQADSSVTTSVSSGKTLTAQGESLTFQKHLLQAEAPQPPLGPPHLFTGIQRKGREFLGSLSVCVCVCMIGGVGDLGFRGRGVHRVQADKAFLRDSHRHRGPQKSFCRATEVESSRSIKVPRQRIYEQRENKRRVHVPYRCSHLSS